MKSKVVAVVPNGTHVYHLGEGEVDGDEVPDLTADNNSSVIRLFREGQHKVPKIIFPNGQYIYAPECWWGPKELIEVLLKELVKQGKKIQHCDVKTVREKSPLRFELGRD